jgi:predicted outer membrane lipoprotein
MMTPEVWAFLLGVIVGCAFCIVPAMLLGIYFLVTEGRKEADGDTEEEAATG